MTSFSSRRWRNLSLLVVAGAVLLLAEFIWSLMLHRSPAVTGWLLFTAIVMLTGYNIRKKLPFLPLGSAAAWLQVHIYLGLFSSLLFMVHIRWQFPRGFFEITLASLYLLVFFSGVAGLWISRTFAKRLTTRGQEIFFERIPRVRHRIQKRVERLVLDCLAETESTAVPEFYEAQLKTFFERHRNFLDHLVQSNRSRKTLLNEIDAQRRYLNDRERETMTTISEHVCVKDDLDYQYTHQAALKYWLFLHVPLTYGLLVFAVFHVIMVYAFSGGMR